MMTRHRGHDGRVVAEACDSNWRAGHQNDERQCLGSLVVSREAVPHSVRNPARVVLHTQGFVDSKSSSNWEEVDPTGGKEAWGRITKNAKAERRLKLTPELMPDVD